MEILVLLSSKKLTEVELQLLVEWDCEAFSNEKGKERVELEYSRNSLLQ